LLDDFAETMRDLRAMVSPFAEVTFWPKPAR